MLRLSPKAMNDFRAADKNHDGVLDEEEFNAFLSGHRESVSKCPILIPVEVLQEAPCSCC